MQVKYEEITGLENIAFIGSLYRNMKQEYKGKLVQMLVEEIGGKEEGWYIRLQGWARGEQTHMPYHVLEEKAREIAQKFGDVLMKKDQLIDTPWVEI